MHLLPQSPLGVLEEDTDPDEVADNVHHLVEQVHRVGLGAVGVFSKRRLVHAGNGVHRVRVANDGERKPEVLEVDGSLLAGAVDDLRDNHDVLHRQAHLLKLVTEQLLQALHDGTDILLARLRAV